jgi:hypothetical protein
LATISRRHVIAWNSVAGEFILRIRIDLPIPICANFPAAALTDFPSRIAGHNDAYYLRAVPQLLHG